MAPRTITKSLRPILAIPRTGGTSLLPLTTSLPRRAFHSSRPALSSSQIPPINPDTPQALRKPLSDLFSLQSRVVLISGGARGVGLTQASALLQAGAKVHALDLLPDPSLDPKSDFSVVKSTYPSSSLTYHRVDVRDQDKLNQVVARIAGEEGRLDGLIAAAGIQQETPALEYTREDSDKMLGVNVTGVFMTAQAVAREMVKRKKGGSIVLIGSMSGTVANRGLICP